jgi:hypothetical protein
MRLTFPAQQVCRGQEPEAALLLCSPDLPGDGQHQGEDGAEPHLRELPKVFVIFCVAY